MFGYIYKTTNLVNGKIYVGKKHKDTFVPTYFGSGKLIKRSIEKYGLENFEVVVLDWAETLDELNKKEIFYIALLESDKNKEHGYNISKGGDGGNLISHLTIEEREKFIENCRKRSTGDKNPNYGNGDKIRGDRNPSKRPEVRKRLSEASSGEGNGMHGVTGDKHPMYGKHMSEKSKEKMRETRRNKKPFIRVCVICDKEFETKSPRAKYCTISCKNKYYNNRR